MTAVGCLSVCLLSVGGMGDCPNPLQEAPQASNIADRHVDGWKKLPGLGPGTLQCFAEYIMSPVSGVMTLADTSTTRVWWHGKLCCWVKDRL